MNLSCVLSFAGATVFGASRHSHQTPFGLMAPEIYAVTVRSRLYPIHFHSSSVSRRLIYNSFISSLLYSIAPGYQEGVPASSQPTSQRPSHWPDLDPPLL